MTTKNDDARADRLKAALRENLKRRKVQVRERGEADASDGGNASDGPDGSVVDSARQIVESKSDK